MNPVEVGNWLRDAKTGDMLDFIEVLIARLSPRELDAVRDARRDHAEVRRKREEAMAIHRADVARREREQAERERPMMLAREYGAHCSAIFGETPNA